MTDREIMNHRYSDSNIGKSTDILSNMLGMSQKEYEDAVRRELEKEIKEYSEKQHKAIA